MIVAVPPKKSGQPGDAPAIGRTRCRLLTYTVFRNGEREGG